MGLFHPKTNLRVSSVSIGNRSEQHLIVLLMAVGYVVLKPVEAGLRYDLVIEDADGRFWRIQCKTGRYKNGSVEFSCGTSMNPQRYLKGKRWGVNSYTSSEIDYFAVWCPDLAKGYLIPIDQTPEKLGKLRVDPVAKWKATNNPPIRWAQDYEL